MFFRKSANKSEIMQVISKKIAEILPVANNGIDVIIRKHERIRSSQQNNLLWAVYNNITQFFLETGFIIDRLPLLYLNNEFLHEYFKARFNVKTTTKLTTKEFMDYVDKIQYEMVEQSKGNYEPIIPDDYIEKTGLLK